MVRVSIKLYAMLRKYRPDLGHGEAASLELSDGSTLHDLLGVLGIGQDEMKRCFVNAVAQEPDYVLCEGDDVVMFPPIAGGGFTEWDLPMGSVYVSQRPQVVPRTAVRVATTATLDGVTYRRCLFGKATVEKVAINAVMAGCEPAYVPVLIAAVEAMAEERLHPVRHQAHRHPVSALAVQVAARARGNITPL